MKKARRNSMQNLVLAAAVSASLGFVLPVHAQEYSYLVDLNSKTITELTTPEGAFRNLPLGINTTGQVVGHYDTQTAAAGFQQHAFITGPNGVGITDIGTLGGGSSQAYGINNTGQVVGVAQTAAGADHAFITGPNGVGMTDLGTLGGNRSIAQGINAAGQVAGYSYTASGAEHAFITGPNGVGMTDLNSLVSVPGVVLSDASAINNHGQGRGGCPRTRNLRPAAGRAGTDRHHGAPTQAGLN